MRDERKLSVAIQAEALATLCGLTRPWVMVSEINLGDSHKIRTEQVVYGLRKLWAIPTRWDRIQRKWADDPKGKVSLSCCFKGARAGDLVIQAKLKRISFGELRTSDGITKRFSRRTTYERPLWCLKCALNKVSAQGGNLGLLDMCGVGF